MTFRVPRFVAHFRLYHLESAIRNTQPSSQFLPPPHTIHGSDRKEDPVASLCRCRLTRLYLNFETINQNLPPNGE